MTLFEFKQRLDAVLGIQSVWAEDDGSRESWLNYSTPTGIPLANIGVSIIAGKCWIAGVKHTAELFDVSKQICADAIEAEWKAAKAKETK